MTPEDFRVVEIPAYEPSGEGEHVFVLFEKRGLTTPQAVRSIAAAIGADASQAGWAGLKDRHAITRQWVSFLGIAPEAVERAEVEGVTVIRASRHPKKLRTGHLRGNRFELRIRGTPADRVDGAKQVIDTLWERGLPNYFGEQRFGAQGQNLERARDWIVRGGRAPRSRFQRKLLFSVFQASLFNRRVAERVRTDTLGHVFEGDLMKKEDTGGLFTVEETSSAQARTDRWEISPTGPMFGAKMAWPEKEALRQEQALLSDAGITADRLSELRRYGAGTRRAVRIRAQGLELLPGDDGFQLRFTLPKGSYATVLVREILKPRADHPKKR